MLKRLFHFFRYYLAVINWRLIKRRDISFHADLVYGKDIFISKKNKISIGKDCFIGYGGHFGADVVIGNSVMLAPRVAFVGGDHDYSDRNVKLKDAGREEFKEIKVESNIWIGYGAIIMHGVTIGEGSVVAAGSVVTKDVDKYSIVAGIPAKKIKDR